MEEGPVVRRQLLYRSSRLEVTPALAHSLNDPYRRTLFLDVSLNYLGCIETDPEVGKAVRRQQPVLLSAPKSRFARRLVELANKLPLLAVNTDHAGNPGFFWRQLFSGPAR